MKRLGKIICLILVVLICAVGVFVWWQFDNLKALYRAKTMDADTILAEAQAQTEARQKELEPYGVKLKTPTREEMDALLNGTAIEPPAEETPAPAETLPSAETLSPAETFSPTGTLPPAEKPPAEPVSAQAIIERCIQELYDCETALMLRLGVMKQEALDEWHSLPKEARTKAKRTEIGYRGLDACYVLEVEIDAQVEGVLARYRAELESIHADTAPMETLWKHYCEEKASAKAYYMNKYL